MGAFQDTQATAFFNILEGGAGGEEEVGRGREGGREGGDNTLINCHSQQYESIFDEMNISLSCASLDHNHCHKVSAVRRSWGCRGNGISPA